MPSSGPGPSDYLKLFLCSPDMLCVADFDGRFKELNPAWEKILGYTKAELLSTPYLEFVHPEDRAATVAAAQKLAQGQALVWFENRYRCRDGSYKDMLWQATSVPADRRIFAAARDISEVKRVREAQKSQGYLDAIINAVGDPIFVKDQQHRWVLLNDAYCRFMGHARSELIGRSDPDFFPQEQWQVFWAKDDRVFQTGQPDLNEELFTDAAGRVHTITTVKNLFTDESGARFIVGTIRDITAHKRMEEQLRQSAKMEAVGRLAGGIAHEFNNMLTGIMGFAHLIKSELPEAGPGPAEAGEIIALSKRAAGLVSQLLAFGQRQAVAAAAAVDINTLVGRNKAMLAATLGEGVQLEMDLAPALPAVRANEGLLDQVLFNLCLNARDAMDGQGRLTIATRRVDLASSFIGRHCQLPPGSYVVVELSDTGSGIAPGIEDRLFEPFFTTKPPGQGTGLGLSVSYGIIRDYGGGIDFSSRPGQGTTFRVFLPECLEAAAPPQDPARTRIIRPSRRTILIADDEAVIRATLLRVLQPYGYTVLAARDGEEALELFQAHREQIALVVLDVVMPKLDGVRAYERMAALRPDAKFLFMNGHATAQAEEVIRGLRGAFIAKPFEVEEIAEKVEEALSL